MIDSPPKRKAWFDIKMEAQQKEIEKLKELVGQNSKPQGELDMDSYIRGFYECMRKYGIGTKLEQRLVCRKIQSIYKGDGDTGFVRRVRK